MAAAAASASASASACIIVVCPSTTFRMCVDLHTCTGADVKRAIVARVHRMWVKALVLDTGQHKVVIHDGDVLADVGIADAGRIRARLFPNGHVFAQFPCGRTIVLHDCEVPLVTTAHLAVYMQRRTHIPREEQEWVCTETGERVPVTADPPEALAAHGVAQHGAHMTFASTGRAALAIRTERTRYTDFSSWVRFDGDTTLADLHAHAREYVRAEYKSADGADYVWMMDGRTLARFADGVRTPEMACTLEALGVPCGALLTVEYIRHVCVTVLAPELGLCERIDTPVDATLGEIKDRARVRVPCVLSLFNGRFLLGTDDTTPVGTVVGASGVPRPFPLHVHVVPEDGNFVVLRRQDMVFMCTVMAYTAATTVDALCAEAARMSGCDAHSVRFIASKGSGMTFDAIETLANAALRGDDERARTLVDVGVRPRAEIVFV